MQFFSICCQGKKALAALTRAAAAISPVSNSPSCAHSCPEELWFLPGMQCSGMGKCSCQQERTVPGAGVGDLPGHNALASVQDLSGSELRERMKLSLRRRCIIFTISMEMSAQVKCLNSCYSEGRTNEYSQCSLEGDSVPQSQVPRAILHSLSYPIWLSEGTPESTWVSCKACAISAMMHGSHIPSVKPLDITATVFHLWCLQ